MKKITIFGIICLLTLSLNLYGQDSTDPAAILEFYDDEYEIQVFDSAGFQLDEIYYGIELGLGDTIKTNGSTAELRLDPNGSIIKLAPGTEFIIETLQGQNDDVNGFALITGKVRTVASRTSGNNNYSIRTPSAVCGVRGTDFGLEVIPGTRDAVAVLQGSVEFINTATGESLTLAPGMVADVFADTFQAVTLPLDQLQEMFREMDFVQLNPADVPGYSSEPAVEKESPPEEPDGEEAVEETETAEAEETVPEAPEAAEAPAEEREQRNILQPVFDFLSGRVGMEIGSITADGDTYGKAIIQPVITLGKFRMGLYLPIIYKQNMFDPDDWYRPRGNNEWSFGTDHKGEGAGPILKDVLADTALKIKYMEYGEQRDRFFFKVGNLNNMTIGHGILMYRYANDNDFPAVRRIGMNLGLDMGTLGIESVINDFAEPEIFGARIYIRPVADKYPFAFGISIISDIDPAGSIVTDPGADTEPIRYGDPVFLGSSFDLDFPLIERDMLSIVLFGDIGAMVPYFRENYGDSISGGLALNALYTGSGGSFALKNYGIATGLFGNVAAADWRLEYRYYNGTFRAPFFGSNYDRLRGQYVIDQASYFADPEAAEYQGRTMGIYGAVGFTIKEVFSFEGGYFWPWEVGPSGFELSDEDYLLLKASLKPGVIPVVGIGASISYERTEFIPTLLNREGSEDLTLFDANTVVKGELVYPAAPILDMAVIVTTSAGYDENGNLISNPDNPSQPLIRPSVSFETRIHF